MTAMTEIRSDTDCDEESTEAGSLMSCSLSEVKECLILTLERLLIHYAPLVIITGEYHYAQSMLVAIKNNHNFPSSKTKTSDPAIKWTNDIIDGAITLSFHNQAQAEVLLLMLTPSMPWDIRVNIWKRLGELRLLHIMEGSLTRFYIVNLMMKPEKHSLVVKSILASLRNVLIADESTWLIYGVAFFHVCHFVYFESRSTSISERLKYLGLGENETDPNATWIRSGLFAMRKRVDIILHPINNESSYLKKSEGDLSILCSVSSDILTLNNIA
jgi:hypothetical protein